MPAVVAESNPVDPTQGLADYLESQIARPAPVARPAAVAKPVPGTKPAVRSAKVAKARSGNRPPAAREAGLPKTVDPVPQPAGQLQPRTAKKPAARPAPVAASRPAEPAPRPFPPDISNPDDDSATPPLDFIPRPHALRPHMRNVGQDESLDGIEDILARLGRHAKA